MKPGDTIFALASSPGRAGVAVLRISGREARRVFELCIPKQAPEPRRASLRTLHDPKNGELIDRPLLLWFPAPHSFTGEDVVELHLHGGRAIINAATDVLQKIPGFRPAEPGEFTRRAFENGRLDLTEAEAIADLVSAETEAQRRQAMRQFEGELGRLYEDWRRRLTHSLAHIEATIDFADEDLPPDMEKLVLGSVRTLAGEIARHLDDKHRGERLREGFHIAILGPPNAGKSSLLNALAKRDAAIVSSIAGTTRDIVDVHLDLGGMPVILADTAGLRESADAIESEGVRRALARAEKADLKLLVFDGATWPKLDQATLALGDGDAIAVVNKADLMGGQASGFGLQDPQTFKVQFLNSDVRTLIPISVKTGQGLPELLARLAAASDMHVVTNAPPPLTRTRHRAALEECADHLHSALAATETALRAEDLRLASRALGRVTGRVDVEDLLDVIFRDFCIGK